MPHRFIAVDVGVGDAFYLQRGDFSALVDGGSRSGFPRLLHAAIGGDTVSVVACTHNDSDHANGILEFLTGGGRADECWLPATWLEAAHRIINASPDDVASLGDMSDEPDDSSSETVVRETVEVGSACVDEQLTKLAEAQDSPQGVWPLGPRWLVLPPGIAIPINGPIAPGRRGSLFADAYRILAIAMAAAKAQIKIRWFDPEHAPKYLVIVEETATGFSAYSPDLPGCVATGCTRPDVEREMAAAVAFHIDGLRAEGMDVPLPRASSTYVSVPA